MSLVIASTTDTQEAVDAAAGIGSSKPQETPSEAPPETPPEETPEPAEESEPPEDIPEQEEHQKKASNVQRRIDRLTRERYQLAGRVQELERRLTESALPGPQPGRQPPPQPAQQMPPGLPQGRPQESQFESYEQYIDALTDWKAAQTAVQAYHAFRQTEEQRRAQEAARAQQEAWMGRVQSMRSKAPDFDETLAAAEDIAVPPALQAAILEHEHGPRLAYELAKQPEVLSRLASLPPVAALRELGKFESKLDLNGEPRRPSAVSKAPPPISPVGQGSSRSTKSPDQMSQEEYRRWRIKGGAWWGRSAQGR